MNNQLTGNSNTNKQIKRYIYGNTSRETKNNPAKRIEQQAKQRQNKMRSTASV